MAERAKPVSFSATRIGSRATAAHWARPYRRELEVPTTRIVGVAAALGALLVIPTTATGAEDKPRPKTLTLFTVRAETEYGTTDVGPTGLSKGDVYISTSPVRNEAGKGVGTCDINCVVVDEDAGGGLARMMCDSVASLGRRGEIVTTSTVVGRVEPPSTFGLGVIPVGPKKNWAIVGGTGKFAGADGVLHRTRTDTGHTLRYRYWL